MISWTSRVVGLWAISVAALAGCKASRGGGTGGSGGAGGASSSTASSGGGGATTGSGAGGAGPDVTGTARDTWITEAGEIKDVPQPSLTIAAVVPSANGFDTIPGTYDTTKGTFVIPGVPQGPYWLKLGPAAYLATSNRVFDLGFLYASRPDAQKITQSPTNLVLDAQNLTAWQDGDWLALFSLGGDAGNEFQALAPMPPAVGSTSLSGFTADLSQMVPFPGVIDASKGDQTFITHLTTRVAGGLPYVAVGQVMHPGPVTLHDGQPTQVSGAFQDVPQQTLTVTWKRSAFAALAAAAGPGATVSTHSVAVAVQPAGKDRTSIGAYALLAELDDTDSTDVTLPLDYGNPFPSSYGVIGNAVLYYVVKESGTGTGRHLTGLIVVSAPVDALFQGPVVPTMSPPTGITVGGQPVTSDVTGVGTTPVIAWSAPAVGTPTSYTVRIYSFDANGKHSAAGFVTKDTSVTVLPGILQAGTSYAAVITADNRTLDLAAPNHLVTSYARADAITALFTP